MNNKLIFYFTITLLFSSCAPQQKYQDDDALCQLLAEMTAQDQVHREDDFITYSSLSQVQKDSILNIQIASDNANTETLIEIIKERGFPNLKKLNCEKGVAPHLIFVHAQEKYWDEIRELIAKEKDLGNLEVPLFDHITWHLNGRQEFFISDTTKMEMTIKNGKKVIKIK